MSLASWNWRKAIAGLMSVVALITVTGGLVSCGAPEAEEEDTEEGVVAPEVGEDEDEDEGEED